MRSMRFGPQQQYWNYYYYYYYYLLLFVRFLWMSYIILDVLVIVGHTMTVVCHGVTITDNPKLLRNPFSVPGVLLLSIPSLAQHPR